MAPRHHILAVVVENKPGVLARVAGLFSRRGFNIFSLAVSPTDDARYSRMTVVVDVESAPLEQVTKQLDKLINVLEIVELAPEKAVERELMLATVGACEAGERSEIGTLASIFEARILDVSRGAMTLMAAGTPEKLDSLEALLRPYQILAIQRTGRIALPRLELSATGATSTKEEVGSGPVLRMA
ncbi:MAG: acetolactate synthase small subunit [Acidimicrobiia bacterium]